MTDAALFVMHCWKAAGTSMEAALRDSVPASRLVWPGCPA